MTRIHHLKTPISSNDIEGIKIGDIVYISGTVITARDKTHRYIIELFKRSGKLPINLDGLVLYHAGPVVKKVNNEWKILSIGPTTSIRMENLESEFIKYTGIKVIIGKGGMGSKTENALKTYKGLYVVFPGGCGVLAAQFIKKVLDVYFLEELGIPEAMWVLEVENFGPLLVVIDSNGNNLFKQLKRQNLEMINELLRQYSISI